MSAAMSAVMSAVMSAAMSAVMSAAAAGLVERGGRDEPELRGRIPHVRGRQQPERHVEDPLPHSRSTRGPRARMEACTVRMRHGQEVQQKAEGRWRTGGKRRLG